MDYGSVWAGDTADVRDYDLPCSPASAVVPIEIQAQLQVLVRMAVYTFDDPFHPSDPSSDLENVPRGIG